MGKFSRKNIFSKSGPVHLTSVDWENPNHRRTVLASLVNGVYVDERDGKKKRRGNRAQAPAWWDSFHFQQIRPLRDKKDGTIFGAVYEYSSYTCNNDAPKYVIAFRGTLIKKQSWDRDIKLDLDCCKFTLHKDTRFHEAIRAVKDVVKIASGANIWLAGHSLGAAIALLVGKNMAKEGKPMKTFLFNPPFVSFPIEWIENEKVKDGIRVVGGVAKTLTTIAVGCTKQNESILFSALSNWIPELFLNPADHFCSGYIGYFRQRKKMEEVGLSKASKIAARQSVRCLVAGLFGKDLEAWHLLPSANLTINTSQCRCFIQAHKLDHWWDSSFIGQYEQYKL